MLALLPQLVLLASVGLGDLPVSLRDGAATVAEITAELAAKSRLPLATSPALDGEVLLVHLKPHPAQVLLQMIADADSAEWQRVGEKWVLTRLPSLKKRQEAADKATLARVVGDWFQGAEKSAESNTSIVSRPSLQLQGEDPHLIGKLRSSALGRLVEKFLGREAPLLIAACPIGVTNRYNSAASPLSEMRLPASVIEGLPDYFEHRGLELETGGDRKPTNSEGRYLSITVSRPDLKRAVVQFFSFAGRNADEMRKIDIPAAPYPSVPSALRDAVMKGVAADNPKAHPMPTPVAPQELARTDPLLLLYGNALGALLAKDLPETIFRVPDQVSSANQNSAASLWSSLSKLLTFKPFGAVLVGAAALPGQSNALKMDRKLLTRLLEDDARTPVGLARVSRYVTDQSDGAAYTGLESKTIQATGQDWLLERYDYCFREPFFGRDVFRFYGSLPDAQIDLLASGERLYFRNLSEESRELLRFVVFNRSSSRYDPSEVDLNDALLGTEGYITVKVDIDDAVSPDWTDFHGRFTSGDLARAIASGQGTLDLKNHRFRFFHHSQIKMTCYFRDTFTVVSLLDDYRYPDSEPVSFSELPEPFRKQPSGP